MRRKVVKHGPATFIVSLPTKWVKRYSIKKGDELDVEEQENTVVISTGKGKSLGKIEVDITSLDRSSLMYVLRVLYKLGYDEITLKFNEQTTHHYRLETQRSVISVVHEELNRLSGIEVVMQREGIILLKPLSEMAFEEFDNMLRRIFLMLIDMSNDLIHGAETNDIALLGTLEEKHNTITKFLSLCMRMLLKKGYAGTNRNILVFNILVLLDKVLDVLKNTGRHIIALKPIISKKGSSLMQNMHKSILLFYDVYYKFDNKVVLQVSELRDTILKVIQKNSEELSKKEIVVIVSMANILELIQAMTEARIALEY